MLGERRQETDADPTGSSVAGEERIARYRADQGLVRASLDGDARALDEFGARMRIVPRTLAVLNARSGKPLGADDIADLSQEALIVVWRKLGTFEGRATLETWVQRFCLHVFLNRVRKERRGRGRTTSLSDADEPVLEPDANDFDGDPERVGVLLDELGSPEAEILRLKHFEELTFDQIGNLLSISANTAKTRYYRGLRWLRERIERGGRAR